MTRPSIVASLLVLMVTAAACRSSEPAATRSAAHGDARAAIVAAPAAPAPAALALAPAPAPLTAPASAPAPAPGPITSVYAWGPSAAGRLDVRFATPAGFARVAVEEGSFSSFLRTLPLLPDDAPVVDFKGTPLYQNGHHDNIAAVVDLDVGQADLQQCADAVFRLNGEWHYGRGDRDVAYRASSGALLSYKKFASGERARIENGKMVLRPGAPARADDHRVFRAYLDEVFAWANTASLERDGSRPPFAQVRAGDAFVMSGSPFGHAVLVLDVARDDHGRTALLLGQSYMPAQSFHVLRPSRDTPWFVVEPGSPTLATPFWTPFPMGALRRLP